MNTTREPLNNANVRKAINLLLNRKEIIDGALFGAGVGMAAMGMAKFVEAMSQLKGEQLDALKFAIIGLSLIHI